MAISLLSLNKISFRIGSEHRLILQDINVDLERGDFLVLAGSNGSGKSTLLKIIAGLYSPCAGHVFLNNKSLHRYSKKQLMQRVVMLSQNPLDTLFADLTLVENAILHDIRVGVRSSDNKHYRAALICELNKYNPKLKQFLDVPVKLLSGGEKQVLALALILRNPPAILLLDEHTAALDPKTARIVMDMTIRAAKQKNITVVMTTHQIDDAINVGNKMLLLENGKIKQLFDGDVKSQMNRETLLACY